MFVQRSFEERGADGKPIARLNLSPEELKQFQGQSMFYILWSFEVNTSLEMSSMIDFLLVHYKK